MQPAAHLRREGVGRLAPVVREPAGVADGVARRVEVAREFAVEINDVLVVLLRRAKALRQF